MADELQNEREKANVMCLEAGSVGSKACKKTRFLEMVIVYTGSTKKETTGICRNRRVFQVNAIKMGIYVYAMIFEECLPGRLEKRW